MALILGSERALFDRYIVAAELNVDDFEITKESDAPGTKKNSSMGYAGIGTVTVTYRPTEIARHYRDGVVPPPHVEFERELKMDEFKTR